MASGKVLIVSIALLAAILQTATASVMFAPCQISTKGTVTNIDITGCNDKSPCKLIRGTNSTIAITFSTTGTAQKLEAVVHGVIAGLPVPFNLPNPDACTTGGLTCPIQTNTQLTYTNSLPILKVYPRVSYIKFVSI
ncbi:Hypothetical predicted protein [Cloeon dipterum]|uniref:MD-2-related lipid-recognition domain-containing protein n=1 Tax=Cloeon dipterum TaxID=197152 RepID=A0A8S1DCA3_9INSE|nr:Hypothetical predicted protein [Cloeon dipterum]